MSTYRTVELNHLSISKELIKMLPSDFIRQNRVLPFDLAGGRLCLAMGEPSNKDLQYRVSAMTGLELDVFASAPKSIDSAVDHYLGIESSRPTHPALESISHATEAYFSTIVQRLVELAIESRASDVHLESQAKGLFVRFRVDGVLHTVHQFSPVFAPKLISRLKVMCAMDIAEKRMPQDGQINMTVDGGQIDLRVSTLPAKYGEKIVIRVLERSMSLLDMTSLGMDSETQARFEALVEQPQGLLLVTGPTGSGKTTTLYAVLNRLKSPLKNVITFEDPIEYELLSSSSNEAGITQVQVNPRIDFTFAAGLRAALRQDPDVLMVGEIRDKETAEVAMKASMTGHTVFSTLHTNDTAQTIGRLRDIGIEPFLIASTVSAVLAQRLLRVLCPKCKEGYTPPMRAVKHLFPDQQEGELIQLYRPRGCDHCNGTGYRGRRGVYELLVMSDELSEMIHQHATVSAIKRFSQLHGVKTLRESALALVRQGLTTLDEVFRHTLE